MFKFLSQLGKAFTQKQFLSNTQKSGVSVTGFNLSPSLSPFSNIPCKQAYFSRLFSNTSSSNNNINNALKTVNNHPLKLNSFVQNRYQTLLQQNNSHKAKAIFSEFQRRGLHNPAKNNTLDKTSVFVLLATTGLAALKCNQIWSSVGRNVIPDDRKKVVILGSGWGGLATAQSIDTQKYDVQIISPRRQFVLTPLLSEVSTGSLTSTSITESVEHFLRRTNSDAIFVEATALDIDPSGKKITCKNEITGETFYQPYDKLVIAVGSGKAHKTPGVDQHTFRLVEASDADNIRHQIGSRLIAASRAEDEAEKKKLLQFTVVGSNPTSLNLAHKLSALLESLMDDFPVLEHHNVRLVITPEKNRNIYESKIQNYYQTHGSSANIEIVTLQKDIESVQKDKLVVSKNESIDFGVCFWMDKGARTHPLLEKIRQKNPKSQKNEVALVTDEYLTLSGYDDIYIVGEAGTLSQKKLIHKQVKMFQKLDRDGNGTLDKEEFQRLFENKVISFRKYPQLETWKDSAEKLFEEGDTNKDGVLSMDEFQKILEKIDTQVTALPRTAAVAFQQGKYLGSAFNTILTEKEVVSLFKDLDTDNSGGLDAKEVKKGLRKLGLPSSTEHVEKLMSAMGLDEKGTVTQDKFVEFVLSAQYAGSPGDWKNISNHKILPFRYKHLGGFEYVGYDYSVTERNSSGNGILDGFGAWWLWNNVMFSRFIGFKQRTSVVFAWLEQKLFGPELK